MTKDKALEELSYNDHQIFDKGTALDIAEAFGLKPRVHKMRDNRSEFKGAYLPWVKEGETTYAIGVRELAQQIADHIGADTSGNNMLGYGSSTVYILNAIDKKLEKAPATN